MMSNNTNFNSQNAHESAGEVKPGAELLELLAEELPVQHDLLRLSTVSSVATTPGATVSTLSTIDPTSL